MDISSIDTRHATSNTFELSRGNSFPFTGYPFGMNYFAIETTNDNWWFHPEAQHYRGFRLTHQPTMWAGTKGDFASVRILPFATRSKGLLDVPYAPQFSTFQPNKLEIVQKNDRIRTTLVPSEYGALMHITAADDELGVIISFPTEGKVTKHEGNVIEGYSLQLHADRTTPLKLRFHIETTSPVVDATTIEDGALQLSFATSNDVTLRLGTSFISMDYAVRNMPQEDEATLSANITDAWNAKLGKIEIFDHDRERVQTFYQNLWRAFLYPMKLYELDEDGEPVHYDMHADDVKPGYLYTNNGFWDTARTVYSLQSLIEGDEYPKILHGFVNSYKEGGYMPKWLSPADGGGMPGNLIDAVLADAVIKGIAPELNETFLEGMLHSATEQDPNGRLGRRYQNDYAKYGYIPADVPESVNNSLDYAFSDWCISIVAAHLGKDELAAKYRKLALNYQNNFDKEVGFMVAKDRDGNFKPGFSPISWGGDFTEGSSWQSTFQEPHDIQGLINLYGGDKAFLKQITTMANSEPKYDVKGYGHIIHEVAEMEVNEFGQINMGNQPSFHLPYLFAFAGKSYYMQPMIKQMMTKLFSAGWQGYPGDEDNGSMASCYIFNSLGFYPFCPGTDQYLFGMPLYDQIIVHLANGKDLTLTTTQNLPQHQFIDHLEVNGEAYHKPYITHETLMNGGNIDYTLGLVPNPDNFDPDEVPYSLTKRD
ncbi:GH92 family glycosyl hydrolase [Lacticaseibacillus mingshuiensis]|uniref:GH92 family glycosyl hydrolase n=1 Tax=Lacticaseibacillus mingshuiensis TaxID=2799574 RepID=A0ABW4CJZ1_9LACO|nr:GH92 family glycosyl hydrolase [Lacticaseibacillus mingshuiensis]